MTDIIGQLVTRTLYFLNIYGIIRNSVIYMIRVYIPYWHTIFTNQSIVALLLFKIFVMYNLLAIVTNLHILCILQLLVNGQVNKVIVNKFNLFMMKLE